MVWKGLKCTRIIEKGPQSVSFIERFFPLLCCLFRVSIIRGSTVHTHSPVWGQDPQRSQ